MIVRTGYKVLRENLVNVGLLNAPAYQYVPGRWNVPLEPLSPHRMKGGGIWVAPTLSGARAYQKYVLRKHEIATRVFRCRIGTVLYKSSCRIKTSKIFFTREDEC